jgi:hypothetical protein
LSGLAKNLRAAGITLIPGYLSGSRVTLEVAVVLPYIIIFSLFTCVFCRERMGWTYIISKMNSFSLYFLSDSRFCRENLCV